MGSFYNHNRRLYPYIFGGAIWLSWLISLLMGTGNFDVAGQVIGTDYMMFYSAGSTLAEGAQSKLYDFEYQNEKQLEILGREPDGFFAYINLPFLAWAYAPLSYLPYEFSFLAWCIINLGLLYAALNFLGLPKVFWLSLTFVPVFSNVSFGQNAFISLFALSLIYYFWKQDKLFFAGFCLALLLYKPQWVLGIGFLWLLNWHNDWKAMVGFTAGFTSLGAFLWLFMFEATLAYFDFAQNVLPTLASTGEFPIWHMHHPRGFLQLLLPDTLADILWIISNLIGLFFFWKIWQTRETESSDAFKPVFYSYAILLTLWVTPHAMIYDWSLLLIPAVLLWQWKKQLRPMLLNLSVMVWVGYLVSTPLTVFQLSVASFAIQISVLIFAYSTITLTKAALSQPFIIANANQK
ncbi:MAG: glycosyltransferase family 87 protein [Chloroflexota bacterium]